MPRPNQDPHAIARERLAERARRLRTLRLRAAGAAVGVFLAAWLALFVPAQQASGEQTSTQATSTTSTAAPVDSATDDTDDFGLVDEDTRQTAEATVETVESAPATTSQS